MTTNTQEEIIVEDRKNLLQDHLNKLRITQTKRQSANRLFIFLAILCLTSAAIFYFSVSNGKDLSIIFLLYGIVLLFLPFTRSINQIDIRIKDVENEIDLLSISDSSIEQRAEKLFKLHQFELKKYYDQSLKQSSWIFGIGVLCILIGFSIIGVSFYLIAPGSLVSDKVVIAILGGVGGILSNFIAVIYLKIYSETIKSLQEFHNRLVLTHHLHFSNFLIAKIKDEKLREQTIAELSLQLNNKSN